jgi:hypothetical protein
LPLAVNRSVLNSSLGECDKFGRTMQLNFMRGKIQIGWAAAGDMSQLAEIGSMNVWSKLLRGVPSWHKGSSRCNVLHLWSVVEVLLHFRKEGNKNSTQSYPSPGVGQMMAPTSTHNYNFFITQLVSGFSFFRWWRQALLSSFAIERLDTFFSIFSEKFHENISWENSYENAYIRNISII